MGLNKLDGQSTDKEAVAQQLATVQQQVEQVKGENEELRNFFQEALHVSSTQILATTHSIGLPKLLASCRCILIQHTFGMPTPGNNITLIQHSFSTQHDLELLATPAIVELFCSICTSLH